MKGVRPRGEVAIRVTRPRLESNRRIGRLRLRAECGSSPTVWPRKQVYECKIVLIGEAAVGKTSLIRRYVDKTFSENYVTTIGTPVSKQMELLSLEGAPVEVNLSIWDIMGNKKLLEHLGEAYFQGCRGALAVFDVTRLETLEGMRTWISAARKAEPRTPILVLGNKIDLSEHRLVTDDEAKHYCRALGLPYIATSAKTGQNVEIAFRTLAQDSLKVFAATVTEVVP
jgi:small GTP-binding protein